MRFFVSSFFPVTGRYRFALTLPEGAMTLSILDDTADGTARGGHRRTQIIRPGMREQG
jgi:DUF1365 family protein